MMAFWPIGHDAPGTRGTLDGLNVLSSTAILPVTAVTNRTAKGGPLAQAAGPEHTLLLYALSQFRPSLSRHIPVWPTQRCSIASLPLPPSMRRVFSHQRLVPGI